MSKKTLTLIIFLFLVTCGLLYLALVTPPYKKTTPPVGPTPTPISVNAHSVLSLMPASASESSKMTQHTLDVAITTGANMVNAVQLELAYDPKALTNVDINPGTFFTQPNVLLKNIDATNGRISYATTEQINLPGKKGSGTVALLSFDILPTFTGTSTTITFLPKTAIAADKVLESVLLRATGYQLVITKPTGISSPSATVPATTGNPYGVVSQPPVAR